VPRISELEDKKSEEEPAIDDGEPEADEVDFVVRTEQERRETAQKTVDDTISKILSES